MQYGMWCENGHFIDFVNPESGERVTRYVGDFTAYQLDVDPDGNPIPLPKFCAQCGTKTVRKCPGCSAFIQYNENKVHFLPRYCTECGAVFPWVTTALQELSRVTDEAEELTGVEKAALKQAYPELTKNTLKSSGAVETVKRYYAKLSPGAVSVSRAVLINLLTEESKQELSGLFHK